MIFVPGERFAADWVVFIYIKKFLPFVINYLKVSQEPQWIKISRLTRKSGKFMCSKLPCY